MSWVRFNITRCVSCVNIIAKTELRVPVCSVPTSIGTNGAKNQNWLKNRQLKLVVWTEDGCSWKRKKDDLSRRIFHSNISIVQLVAPAYQTTFWRTWPKRLPKTLTVKFIIIQLKRQRQKWVFRQLSRGGFNLFFCSADAKQTQMMQVSFGLPGPMFAKIKL